MRNSRSCVTTGASPPPRALVRVARLSNVLILAIALAIMARLDSIKVAWETSLLLGAGVGIVLVLRWLWWRITAWGELAAIGVSAVLAPATLLLVPDSLSELRVLVSAAGSTAAAVATSLWVGRLHPADLREFYLRVRPPGFWGPVAAAAGADPREPLALLRRGVAATALSAITVFCLLIGLGTWLLDATPPAWLPYRGAWVALNLAIGMAVIPVWLRLGFKPGENTAK